MLCSQNNSGGDKEDKGSQPEATVAATYYPETLSPLLEQDGGHPTKRSAVTVSHVRSAAVETGVSVCVWPPTETVATHRDPPLCLLLLLYEMQSESSVFLPLDLTP